MPGGVTRAKELEIEKRRAEVAKLALLRMSSREIGKIVGRDHTVVLDDLNVIHERWLDESRAGTARFAAQESARLNADELKLRQDIEKLRASRLPLVERIELEAKLQDRLLRIMERRAKLLGLDAPTKTEAIVQARVETSAIARAAETDPQVRDMLEDLAARVHAPPPAPVPAELPAAHMPEEPLGDARPGGLFSVGGP